ncbi:glycosyltransferase family 2 protein [Pedobacter sp. L105]|uniref:glycosyltransferase family 2 protein n=1 Tax=Pedobacter sp. L105 TaxID=1641871 RepID=UPI00131BA98F|nr:glycosyltransferase family 2 protein [Pedobacter sp. L105]
MIKSPQISIVIPVFNGRKFLQDTVRSVVEQLFEDFELLIVNDGSTDDTEEIALSLSEIDHRIFYYKRANAGVSASRNFGLEKARGEFVVFLDADDLLKPDFLQSRVTYLLANPQVGVCGSFVQLIDEHSQLKQEAAVMHAPGEHMLEEILYYTPNITTVPSNLMHRRALLADHLITFDTRLNSSADKMILCRLSAVTTAHCLPLVTLFYRVHSHSMYHDPQYRRMNFKDSELFIRILIREHIIPKNNRHLFLVKNYYMLAGAAWKTRVYSRMMWYGMKYFLVKSGF